MRQARAAVAAAGISVEYIPASRFSPGIPHRRVLLAHVCARNGGVLSRLPWLTMGVCVLHSMYCDCIEFRDAASGALQAFCLVTTQGGYCAGALYACRPEVARAGIWATNVAMMMEQMVAQGGCLTRARFFDAGPTFGEKKEQMGMHPLPFWHTLRMAAFSRSLTTATV